MKNKNSLFSFLLLLSMAISINAIIPQSNPTADAAEERLQRQPLIPVQQGVPGIRSLFEKSPETAKLMSGLAEELLVKRATPEFPRGDREIVASFISNLNKCQFCTNSHSAAAAAQLKDGAQVVEEVKKDYTQAPISLKLKALLAFAAKVHTFQDGTAQAEEARKLGATDIEIHDTALITAAFNMYNRYVDGLNSWTPTDPKLYAAMGKHLADNGYMSGRPSVATSATTQTGK